MKNKFKYIAKRFIPLAAGAFVGASSAAFAGVAFVGTFAVGVAFAFAGVAFAFAAVGGGFAFATAGSVLAGGAAIFAAGGGFGAGATFAAGGGFGAFATFVAGSGFGAFAAFAADSVSDVPYIIKSTQLRHLIVEMNNKEKINSFNWLLIDDEMQVHFEAKKDRFLQENNLLIAYPKIIQLWLTMFCMNYIHQPFMSQQWVNAIQKAISGTIED